MTQYTFEQAHSSAGVPAKRSFQELPRLQVPPLALSQPAQPTQPLWKRDPVIPPPQPSRMSVSNILSSTMGSLWGRSNPSPPPPPQAPKVLPSFQEVLARTNQLHLVGSTASHPVAPSNVPALPVTPIYHQRNYAAYAPPSIVVSGVDTSSVGDYEMSSPVAPCSPVSQTSESSKRRERWTEDEHARFMEGLNRYGRKWKKIQTFVKTKTAVQVRTHAYGYFAKLLRNMPEDDAIWELAEEMSSLPGAVLKGPGNGKRRNEPKTDEEGMEVLRRFVFTKKKNEDKKPSVNEDEEVEEANALENQSVVRPAPAEYPIGAWNPSAQLNVADSAASSVMLDLKRQRLN